MIRLAPQDLMTRIGSSVAAQAQDLKTEPIGQVDPAEAGKSVSLAANRSSCPTPNQTKPNQQCGST